MITLNKDKLKNNFGVNSEMLVSVCSSCACGGGTGSCNTTCKGCKDKNDNVKEVKKIYSK